MGSALGLEKTLHTENKLKKTKIKDGHNGTKIGASNIFRGNQLRFQISLSKSSNNSDIDNSFRSNFCHQEGSGTISNILSYWADQYGSIGT